MELNNLKPGAGSKHAAQARRARHRQRPGQDRGPRPQGQKSAPAGHVKVGFEGGQMPFAAPAAEARLQFADDVQAATSKCVSPPRQA